MTAFSAAHAATLLRAHSVAEHPEASRIGVADFLYAQWYALAPVRVDLDTSWPPVAGMLRVAQMEALGWDPAVVVRRGAGGVVVVRDATGRARALLPGSYSHVEGSDRAGLPPGVGDHVVVVNRSGGIISEGWWRTWGGGWDPRSVPDTAVRVYFSPQVSSLPTLVGRLTASLERRGEAWMMKAATDSRHLGRPDALVLYLPTPRGLDDIVALAAHGVRPEPGPPLTAPLAPGIAWADDPGDGRSFGESRCAIIAEALARADGRDAHAFLAATHDAFLAAGLDPAAPHLRGRDRG